MKPKKTLVVAESDVDSEITLEELCLAVGVTPDYIYEVIEYGVIEPVGQNDQNLKFTLTHLKRLRTAIHLQKDLEVNLPGAALALDLMEELEQLREQLQIFQNSLLK